MVALLTCKNEEDPTIMQALEWSQHFSHCKFMGIFFRRSRATNSAIRRRIRLKVELIQYLMVVIPTCKNEEDTIKSKGARVVTSLHINFLDTFLDTQE